MPELVLPPGDEVRQNGCRCPWSSRQVAAIVLVVLDLLLFCVFLAPLLFLTPKLPVFLGVIFVLLFVCSWIIMAVAGVMTMTTDPQDPMVGEEEELDDDYDALWCRYCKSNVGMESKHCWECHKCVDGFDHHCPWLNTCIGSANYSMFYTAAAANLAMLSIVVISAITLLVVHSTTNMNSLSVYGFLKEVGLLVFLILVLVLNVPLWALDATLVAFHSYLIFQGITTYDYLTGKVSARRKEKDEAAQAALNADDEEEDAPIDESVPPFVSLVAEEGDSELKKSVHEFVFGSSLGSIKEGMPPMPPEAICPPAGLSRSLPSQAGNPPPMPSLHKSLPATQPMISMS